MTHQVRQIFAWALAAPVLVVTVLPFSSSDHWTVRIWDFPRLQILCFGLLSLILLWNLLERSLKRNRTVLLLCAIASAYQAVCIWPYTPLHFVQTENTQIQTSDRNIRVLTANVLQTNEDSGPLLKVIDEQKPDVILLTEVDKAWTERLLSLEDSYPNQVLHPLSNTYGIALYSSLELKDSEIRYLVEQDIPSIFTTIILKSGHQIQFVGLHPRPPGPTQAEDTQERDAELIVVAKEIADHEGPVILAGDLNDVAWSRTTTLFKAISQSLDPRVGRGMFNSFHAHYPPLRFPLDHIFHSDDFRLAEIRRLPAIKSDHFPLFVNLSLETTAPLTQKEPKANAQDRKEGEEILEEVREPEAKSD